jgi:hypothetical protein
MGRAFVFQGWHIAFQGVEDGAKIEGDMLIMSFAKGITVECEGSNLEAILDSIWTARLQIVEETREIKNSSRVLAEGEIVVESLRYCAQAEDLDL